MTNSNLVTLQQPQQSPDLFIELVRKRAMDLSLKHYVYLWADGIYSNVRDDNSRSCILVIIGATNKGEKELIVIDDSCLSCAPA